MGMTLDDIKTKIGRRVGDPLLDTYADEVQDYFEQALTTLVRKTGDKSLVPVYLNEITPSIQVKSTVIIPNSLHYNEIEINNTNFSNLMKIFTVDSSATNSIDKIFTFLEMEAFDLIVKNSNIVPVSIQGYWATDGKVVKIYTSETITVRIKYLQNPIPSSWNIIDDFVNDLGYGYGFIIDCIELASSLLRRQIGIEG